MPAPRTQTAALAVMLGASGVTHLVRPQTFEPIIPAPLRDRSRELVLWSGVAELVCAAGLLHPATRRPAGYATVALLAGVLPANVQMSLDHGRRAQRKGTTQSQAMFAGTLARLPLQWPLIKVALRAARGQG